MKKSTKYELVFVATALSCTGLYLTYTSWESWFPDFQVGMCLEHRRSGRQFRLVEDTHSTVLDTGVPARVVREGIAPPGSVIRGGIERISVDDPKLRIIGCPEQD